jgi:hypothetical protein
MRPSNSHMPMISCPVRIECNSHVSVFLPPCFQDNEMLRAGTTGEVGEGILRGFRPFPIRSFAHSYGSRSIAIVPNSASLTIRGLWHQISTQSPSIHQRYQRQARSTAILHNCGTMLPFAGSSETSGTIEASNNELRTLVSDPIVSCKAYAHLTCVSVSTR